MPDIIPSSRAQNIQGMGWMVVSGALFGLNFSIIRMLGEDLHAFEIVFFRNLFGFLVLVPWLIKLKRSALVPRRPGLLFGRGLLQAVGLCAWYIALISIPIADATALSMIEPILTSLVAVILLRERAGSVRWVAGVAGLVGTLILIRPGFQDFEVALLLPLMSALCWAFYLVVGKILTRTEEMAVVIAYPIGLVVPLTLIPALFFWQAPSWEHYGWFIVSGALTSSATYSITKAYQLADATAVSPLAFVRLIFASLFAFIFFAQVPSVWTWVGGGIIVLAATYLAHHESRQENSAPPAS